MPFPIACFPPAACRWLTYHITTSELAGTTMSRASRKVFIGPLVHAVAPTIVEYIPCAILGVNPNGTIAFVAHNTDKNKIDDVLIRHGWAPGPHLVRHQLACGQFMCPGFIDTHTHGNSHTSGLDNDMLIASKCCLQPLNIPTWPGKRRPTLGSDDLRTSFSRGQQYELLEWLHQITFPTEEKFKDVNFAKKVYADVIRRVVSFGVGSITSEIKLKIKLATDYHMLLLWHAPSGGYESFSG